MSVVRPFDAMMLFRLLRCKSLDQLATETIAPQFPLKRALGPVYLTLLGVGAVIGDGIFSYIGAAVAGGTDHSGAGPATLDAGVRLAGQAFADAPRLAGVPLIFNVRAFSIVMLLTWNLVRGIRESSWFNSAMVIVKLVILVFFMALGAFYVKLENWTPFAPNGWADITSAAVIIFFGYIGFDAVSTAAEETRQPQRNVPIGILASLAICTVLYFVVAVVLTGLMHGNQLDTAEPLAMAFSGLGLNWAVGIISVGALVANTSVLFVFQLGQPRIFFSMARDGLLSAWAAKVHPRHRTPHVTTILTGVLVAGFAGVMNINEVVELCNIGTLFAFVLVAAGILVLRHTDPDRRRSLRAAVSVGTVGRDPFLRLADGPVAARNLVALHSLARIWTADLLSLRIAAQPAEFSHQ